MSIRVFIHTPSKRAETPALLDSGATENFINHSYATYLRLPVKRLPTPRKIFNVDGTTNKRGDIRFYTDLEVRTGERRTNMRFFLTELGPQKMILGYPWFAATQPKIDWAKGWIDYTQLPVVIKATNAEAFLRRFVEISNRKQKGKVQLRRTTFQSKASQLAERAHQSEDKPTSLPPHYRQHARVFNEQQAQRFPKPRVWDHAIDLKPDAPTTLPGKVYSLTQTEQQVLQDFVKEHLAKGYIRPSKSPYAAPFFFIKKKDGKLRPVQDYRKVNEWTIRNRYPLPLIPELINRVKGATLFSKFDVRWGYNNVRIKAGDEWKAAFITNLGLFEPRVMFFGLTNSPATFQTMMNEIFAEELREGWLSIYMDDILVHTPHELDKHRECVHRILTKLEEHDLYLKPEKCLFEQEQVEFLGVILRGGTIQMDPAKVKGVADWPPPLNVKDVRAFLGFTGFYRYFVHNYSKIARPLIDLTKKATPFHWGPAQTKAFETLKTIMCSKPILRQPDYKAPFFLATDASAYGVGAVLSQEGGINPRNQKPVQHPIAYYSATFIPAERNYDIYERELLAVLKSLEHWRPHLAATEKPVTVLTDHANLTFWKNPRKVNRRVARWFATLQDYNLRIKHVPGKLHAAPDMLSRRPDANKGEEDNQDLTLLPAKLFVRLTTEPSKDWMDMEKQIARLQQRHHHILQKWERKHHLRHLPSTTVPGLRLWHAQGRMVVPPEELLRRSILYYHHGRPTSGHPGRDETIRKVSRNFWWPGLNDWVAAYVKGCATCQQNKNLTHRNKPPLFRIPPSPTALPFQSVAMDLITQLPNSQGSDAILTIVDQGCTRAAVFLPCKTSITAEGVAQLYLEHVYRWFGLPTRVISDRDPRFTSHFARALCEKLHIQQNISTAFHPQTDGLSERKNQWIEQFLRLVTHAQQEEWKQWLPIATAVHNNYTNTTTRVAPARALLGYLPTLDPLAPSITKSEQVEERAIQAFKSREQAREALRKAANTTPEDCFKIGDHVWLEAKNLTLPYQTRKLAPKRHGPFEIVKRVSPVAYQLQLPPTWTIHNVFHASLLTPYHETIEHGPNYPRPSPEMVDGSEEFEVETIMGHRFFGRGRKLQYLIKWKGYPVTDNTWEQQEQVFAPKLITEYHKRHPLSTPFPHKKALLRVGRVIPSTSFSCQTSPETPPTSPLPRPLSQSPSRTFPQRFPLRWTLRSCLSSPPLQNQSRFPRRATQRPMPKMKKEHHSPPSQGSPSSKRLEGEEPYPNSEKSPRGSPAPSLIEPPTMNDSPMTSGGATPVGSMPSPTLGEESKNSRTKLVPESPLLLQDSLKTMSDSLISISPSEALEPEPDTSGSVLSRSLTPREPWVERRTRYTLTPSKRSPKDGQTSPNPPNRSRSGSSTSSMHPKPTLADYLRERGTSATGGSQRTSSAIGPPTGGLQSSTAPGRVSTLASLTSGNSRTSPSSAWEPPTLQTASELSDAWATPWAISAGKFPKTDTPKALEVVAEPEAGLPSKRRVMLSPRSVPLRPYAFCQELSPELAHDGGPCTCFDAPSDRF
jgi:RNase H-like domain found in reverse transcriptase/Reverse transcriptase (RNA-dependent DNA polymerase)/Integrase zinc binding domain/Chromo (CHRromatin Organisation MOdifier) domain